jgi:uncharacterized iron-regulated membrane protein
MRKWHRWTTIFFGLFMLWMAVTGLASHVTALWPETPPPGYAPVPEGFVCPETMSCRPKPAPGSIKTLVGLFHHLHSGEQFGPVGTVISIMTGLALAFFSVSGVWMYVSMWRNRKDRNLNPRWFWR